MTTTEPTDTLATELGKLPLFTSGINAGLS